MLDRVVVYLGEHGLGDVSFRPMAKSLGVSVNALVHHFGTKDDLIAAALRRAGEIQDQVERQWWQDHPDMTVSEWLRTWWRWTIATPEHLAMVRLGIEAVANGQMVNAGQRAARRQQIDYWQNAFECRLVAVGVPKKVAVDEATLIRSVFTGLVIDLIASGNKARVNRSFERFLTHVDAVLDGVPRPTSGARSAPVSLTS